MSTLTIAFRLGKEHDEKMESGSVLDAHLYHAKAHDNKVLFTTQTGFGETRYECDNLILTTQDGSKALLGEIIDQGTLGESKPASGYELPSQWSLKEEQEKNFEWFALDNVKFLPKSELKLYHNSETKKSLLDSLSGANSRIYVIKHE